MPKATIVRRSGRRSKEHRVFLKKPPEDYRQGEKLVVNIDGRDIPVYVEIPIDNHFKTLYVA
jgi:hypothetical protein